jgi:hypothetical protein
MRRIPRLDELFRAPLQFRVQLRGTVGNGSQGTAGQLQPLGRPVNGGQLLQWPASGGLRLPVGLRDGLFEKI